MRRSPGKIARRCAVAGPGEAALPSAGGGPEAPGARESRRRGWALAAALLLGLGACSQASDRAGGLAGGCTPACGGLACGSPDGCGGSCAPGAGCTPGLAGHVVEGTPTQGALEVAGPSYRVRGALSHGSSRTLQSTSYRIEQGTLR